MRGTLAQRPTRINAEVVGLIGEHAAAGADTNYEGSPLRSVAYLAQPAQQPTVEWLAGGTFSVLLDAAATNGHWGLAGFA